MSILVDIRTTVIAAIFAVAAIPAVSGQTASDSIPPILKSIEDTGKVTIRQPERLASRLGRVEGEVTKDDDSENTSTSAPVVRGRTGYRVEVFADNNVRTAKIQAAARKRQIQSRFPNYGVYLVFESPFWRVRLGDFSSRAAAESAMAEVKAAMPALASSARVVRCTINP